jgi:hypothetical protein
MRSLFSTLILLVLASTARAGEVDRLYVIDCGWAHASDQSLWSPGVNAGVPIDFADDCYLIHHSSEGYLLWDTGITDRLAAVPDGVTIPALGQTRGTAPKPWWRRSLPSKSSPRMCATSRSRMSTPTMPAMSTRFPARS